VAWHLAASAFLFVPIVWIVVLVRDAHYRFNEGFVPTLGITIVVIILFVIGLAAGTRTAWAKYLARNVLESECPSCGMRATREFDKRFPTSCANCPAYLRAEADVVREEQADAIMERFNPYRIAASRYLPAATRDEQGKVVFKMPPMCAMCCADANGMRDITDAYAAGDAGILGTLAEEAAYGAMSRESRARTGLWGPTGTGNVRNSPSRPTNTSEVTLDHLKLPVCAVHASGLSAIEHASSDLCFASYRYYKEFLALNYIDAPITQPR
jgi:hypothetical protein